VFPNGVDSLANDTGRDEMKDSKVLFVDDEQMVLDGFQSNLRKRYQVATALGPEAGLHTVQAEGPFAVVVSDLKMPGMDGITFLSKVREMCPDTTRIMLTGFAEIDAAIEAVNQGQVFRFLTKPCPVGNLVKALESGVDQYRLVTAERELLHGTLRGTIRVLAEALGLANPEAFGRSQRVKSAVSRLSKVISIKSPLELELATMLSHLGCMGLHRSIFEKLDSGQELTSKEKALYADHPRIGAMLIQHIPRLGSVAEIIADQHADYSQNVPQGARILRLVLDYDTLENKGMTPFEIFLKLRDSPGSYDPELLDALESIVFKEGGFVCRRLTMRQLKIGMVLDQHIMTNDGLLLLAKGAELNEPSILRLIESTKYFEIVEPVCVLVPV
jgi:response regulator RpfG family c-di-GMP phosphodiesterase